MEREGTDSVEPSTEHTPLLPHHSGRASSPSPTKRARSTHGFVFAFLAVLFLFIYNVQRTLPAPLSDAEAEVLDDFAGLHCFNEYLSRFNLPHSGNQWGNAVIKNWIVSTVGEFATEARENGIQVDLQTKDNTTVVLKKNKYSQDEYWFMESNNVMIRLRGQSGSIDNALLVNVHYDSVSTSHGVTDNGMGTAVAMELLRYFARHPPAKTIIFLFNDLEENGLVGAETFVKHPWFKTVELFVNLEGTGAGGRALLFRGSSLDAVHLLATSGAHLLHASPLGNDLLQAKLVRSDTDYTTFTAHGVPGLDIAFYTPRSHYHTQRDDLAHTTADSLQHMGQMALGSVRSVVGHPVLSQGKPHLDSLVYYDILGRVLLVYSFQTCQALNIFALVAVLLGSLSWTLTRSCRSSHPKEDFAKRLSVLSHGLFAVMAAAVAISFCMIFAAFLMSKLNSLMTYGNGYVAVLYLIAAALLGLTLSQYLLAKTFPFIRRTLADSDTILHGLTAFWWFLVVLAAYLCPKKVAGVYFAVYFLVSSSLACVLSHEALRLPSKIHHWRSELVAVVQMLFPVILMTEFCLLAINSMRHTTADGTPEMSVYLLTAVPILLVSLHLLPWAQRASAESLRPTSIAASGFALLLIICLFLSPFNAGWSPNRTLFYQEYNTSASLSTVTLVSGPVGLEPILRRSLIPQEADTVSCGPLPSQTQCTYQTDLIPVYGRDPDEIDVQVQGQCDASLCKVNVTAVAQHSSFCRLSFDKSYKIMAVANGHSVTKDVDLVGGLMIYSQEVGKPMTWQMEYSEKEGPKKARISCLYDDWTNGELPAFTTLRSRLPEWSLLSIRGGVGLTQVHFDSFDI